MKPQPAGNDGKTVFIVDDHPLFRRGVAECLVSAGFEVVGEAADPVETLEQLHLHPADVAVVDLYLAEGSGLELIHDLRRLWPEMKILVLTMKDESFHASRVMRAGANGFISKASRPERIIEAIQRVCSGGVYVSEAMASRIIGQMTARARAPAEIGVELLTDREVAVLEMIGSGMPARRIAKALSISPKTVDSHRQHIKAKLKLDNAAALSRFALEWVSERSGK